MDILNTIRESLAKNVKIIIVDDEVNILSSLNREMRNQGFSIETFSDSNEALKRLEETEFALIISDNVMPKRTGIELLSIMKKKHPATKRFLLTGKTSTEDAINAFNSGIIHRFISKPWDRVALGHEVQAAIESYLINKVEQQVRLLKGKIIEKRTNELKEIKKDLVNAKTQLSFAQDQTSDNQPVIPDEMKGLKYMIVEAKDEIAVEYTKALKHVGINDVVHYTNGIDALKHYEDVGADIILSEWDLDQISGLDLLRLIRKKKNVP